MIAVLLLPHACRDYAAFAPSGSDPDLGAGNGGEGLASHESGAAGFGGSPLDPPEGESGSGGQPEMGSSGAESGGSGAPVVSKDPSEFERLSFWLVASSEDCAMGADDRVVQWKDRSDNQNHADAEGGRPMPSFVDSVVAGHGVVHFEPLQEVGVRDKPASLRVTDSDSVRLGREDFTYAIVARWTNSVMPQGSGPVTYSGVGSILSKHEEFLPFTGVELLANFATGLPTVESRFVVRLGGGGLALSKSDGLNDNVFRVYVARRSGTSIGVRINGVDENSSHVAEQFDASAEDNDLYIGGVDAQPFAGDIAEIVAIKGRTTDADIAGLERHLLEKYALE